MYKPGSRAARGCIPQKSCNGWDVPWLLGVSYSRGTKVIKMSVCWTPIKKLHAICVDVKKYQINVNYYMINTLRSRQIGHHFPDNIFKYIYLNGNLWISIKISLKFVPKCPINNIPAFVQIMVWCWPGDNLSEPMRVGLLAHMCHLTSMS